MQSLFIINANFLRIGLLILIAGLPLQAALSVSLKPSIASPAPLGTVVHWSASVPDAGTRPLWYRFRSRPLNSSFSTIVDYGPNDSLDWTHMDLEGVYQVEVSVQDKNTGETATATANFELQSRLTDATTPAISTTNHPLVFLYSAPGCASGGRMRVQFTSPEGTAQFTPYLACHARSMNFYLAGMRPETQYTVQHTLDTGSAFLQGPMLTISTPAISLAAPQFQVFQPPPADTPEPILLQCALYFPLMATDLSGNVLWYYTGQLSTATRAVAGGYFMGLYEYAETDSAHQYFRKFDLAGITQAETNAARVSEQLVALGKRPINAFHHEARAIAGGKYLVLADNEQILTDVQGPGAVDVIGDEILVLDENLQVEWAWDAFDHLDASRAAVLGEVCPSGAGCAPFYQSATATDWLHGNSVQLTPDGQILYSARHQDWLIKINYDSGLGDGQILWRLGKDGDFQIVSSDPSPWFSHQHDGNLAVSGQTSSVTVFDDGNTRRFSNPNANSRGQLLRLDEENLTATLILNADLGQYSFALGAAERLLDGGFHYDAGWITSDPLGGSNASRSIEVGRSGQIVYGAAISTPEYRTYRMANLYTSSDR